MGGGTTNEATLAAGLLHLRRGAWKSAERAFRKLGGVEAPFLRQLAVAYLRIVSLEAKRAAGRAAMEDLVALGEACWAVGERIEGEEVFREALSLYPEKPLVFFSFARALERSGRFAEAEEHYSRALALPIKRTDFGRMLAKGVDRTRILVALEDHPNEVSRVTGAGGEPVTVDPWSPELRLRAGRLLLDEGMLSRASVQLRVAVNLAPESAAAHELLGIALARREIDDEAAGELKLALRLDPDRDDARKELGRLGR